MSISAAMATYNGQPYIKRQVESMLQQTIGLDEIVIADDGSTDHTLKVCQGLIEGSAPRLSLVQWLPPAKEPLGPTLNFERALQAANGEIVFLADQDDVWAPSRVAAALQVLDTKPDVLLVAHDAQLTTGGSNTLNRTLFESVGLSAAEQSLLNSQMAVSAICKRSVLAGMGFAVRRKLLDIALPIRDPWPHDSWLVAVAACLGALAVVADASHLQYRQHEANAVGAGSTAISNRVRRVLTLPNDARCLYARYAALAEFLEEELHVESAVRATVAAKVGFERDRLALAEAGAYRFVGAGSLLRRGGYRKFASNGNWNVIRDLVKTRQDPRA